MELQKFIDSNIDNYVTEFKKRNLFVKFFSKENLILVKYKYGTEITEEWMRYCRGCIIDKNTNKIIFVPPIKAKEISYPIELDNQLFNTQDIEITSLVDGTMVNMFFHNNKWLMSTRSDIGCLNKWGDKLNFRDMFIESIGTDKFYEKLDPNITYSFILVNKRNRNISMITDNYVLLIETYEKNTLNKVNSIPELNIFTKNDIIMNLNSIQNINYYFENADFNYKGLNILINGERFKIVNKRFIYVKELCVNSTNLLEKFIDLKKKNNIKIFLYYYPEHNTIFTNYMNKYDIMKNELYDNYVKKYISKEIELKDVPFQLKPLLFDLHKIYLNNKKKITKRIVDVFLKDMNLHRLIFIMKYY